MRIANITTYGYSCKVPDRPPPSEDSESFTRQQSLLKKTPVKTKTRKQAGSMMLIEGENASQKGVRDSKQSNESAGDASIQSSASKQGPMKEIADFNLSKHIDKKVNSSATYNLSQLKQEIQKVPYKTKEEIEFIQASFVGLLRESDADTKEQTRETTESNSLEYTASTVENQKFNVWQPEKADITKQQLENEVADQKRKRKYIVKRQKVKDMLYDAMVTKKRVQEEGWGFIKKEEDDRIKQLERRQTTTRRNIPRVSVQPKINMKLKRQVDNLLEKADFFEKPGGPSLKGQRLATRKQSLLPFSNIFEDNAVFNIQKNLERHHCLNFMAVNSNYASEYTQDPKSEYNGYNGKSSLRKESTHSGSQSQTPDTRRASFIILQNTKQQKSPPSRKSLARQQTSKPRPSVAPFKAPPFRKSSVFSGRKRLTKAIKNSDRKIQFRPSSIYSK